MYKKAESKGASTMSVLRASLLRRVALTLVAGAAIVAPMSAKASLTDGLSLRVGFFHPVRSSFQNVVDFGMFGGGVEYKVPWVPKVFNGEHWSTSISADFHYSERGNNVVRYIPVSINQVYSFEEQNGHTPYAGFCVTAATFGGELGAGGAKVPTVTRFGAGVILGLNWTKSIYLEGRYEWFDKHHAVTSPEGFRGYIGYRF
jgi:hypothetical protein